MTTYNYRLDSVLNALKHDSCTTGLKQVQPMAEQGNALAQYNLGVMYYYGHNVEQDYDEAVKWWRLAADQGHAYAQHYLANMYFCGYGVTRSYEEAASLYRLAAEQGMAVSQHNLGSMYANGQGITQDYVQAHKWFSLASVSRTDDTSADIRRQARVKRDIVQRCIKDDQGDSA